VVLEAKYPSWGSRYKKPLLSTLPTDHRLFVPARPKGLGAWQTRVVGVDYNDVKCSSSSSYTYTTYPIYCTCFRIITYGTSNVSRYLIYKNTWRWHGGRAAGAPESSSTTMIIRPIRKLMPVTVGISILGYLQWMYVKKRITPNEGESIRPASNWEVSSTILCPRLGAEWIGRI